MVWQEKNKEKLRVFFLQSNPRKILIPCLIGSHMVVQKGTYQNTFLEVLLNAKSVGLSLLLFLKKEKRDVPFHG